MKYMSFFNAANFMKHPLGFFEGRVLKPVCRGSPNRLQEDFEIFARESFREQQSALAEKTKSAERR
jgi:hypothetical protein